jgi:MFS-type transporter involved in bile tolerance (Atg22 family)
LNFNNKTKTFILLALIWFIISLPLPWIINNPTVSEDSFYTYLGIIGILSIPFVMLGIAWSIKPELTT